MAQSKVSFSIDFAEAASYEGLVDGLGSVSLLKKDGIYSAVINRVSLTESKEAKNPMFLLGLTVQDEDEKGAAHAASPYFARIAASLASSSAKNSATSFSISQMKDGSASTR